MEFTVPVALDKVAKESVIIGSYYGELMLEMLNIPTHFWEQHEDLANNLRVMIEEFLDSVKELTVIAKAIMVSLSRVYPWMAQWEEDKEEEPLIHTICRSLFFSRKNQAEAAVKELQAKGYKVWLEKVDRGYRVVVINLLLIDEKFCNQINKFDSELEEITARYKGKRE